jgi:hypothetical protein
MTFQNLGFEDEGGGLAKPEHWSASSSVTTEEWAGYPIEGGNLLRYSQELHRTAVWVPISGVSIIHIASSKYSGRGQYHLPRRYIQ